MVSSCNSSTGPETKAFEQEFAAYLGGADVAGAPLHAIAVNSATVQGQQSVDPIQRTWRERITPVAIHHSLVKGAATNALRFIGGRVN